MRARGAVGVLAAVVALVALSAGAAASADPMEATAQKPDPDDVVGTAKEVLGDPSGGGSGGDGTAPSDPSGPGPVEVDPGTIADQVGFAGATLILGGIGAALGAMYGGARIVSKDELLENDTRDAIYRYLKAETGANLKEVTEALDLTTTNAIWHLRKLEEGDLVRSDKFNGYRVFYPAEGGKEARKLTISKAALSNDNARDIFEYITANPGVHQRKIARALDVNHGTVRWHLKKLRKAELLDEVDEGRSSNYFPTDVGERALESVAGGAGAAASPS